MVKFVSSLQSLNMLFQLVRIRCFFRAEQKLQCYLLSRDPARLKGMVPWTLLWLSGLPLKTHRGVCGDALDISVPSCVLPASYRGLQRKLESWGWCSWRGIWDAYFEVQQSGALLQVFFCKVASDFPNSIPLPHKLCSLFTELIFCELLRELFHSSIKLYSYFYLN